MEQGLSLSGGKRSWFPRDIEDKIVQHMFDDPPLDPLYFKQMSEHFRLKLCWRPLIHKDSFHVGGLQRKICMNLWVALFCSDKPVLLGGIRYHGITTALLLFARMVLQYTTENVLYVCFSLRDAQKAEARYVELFDEKDQRITFVPIAARGHKAGVIIVDTVEYMLPEWVAALSASFLTVSYTRFFSSTGLFGEIDSERLATPVQDFLHLDIK